MLNNLNGDMENIKEIYFTGDIHGNFEMLIFCIIQKRLYDAAVIVAGDIGMGFYKHNYYIFIPKTL